MGGNLIERLQKLIKSELFDAPDTANGRDYPETIEELEAVLKSELGVLLAERYNLRKQVAQTQPSIEELAAKAERALELGREDLAKAALTQRGHLNGDAQDLNETLGFVEEKIVAVENMLNALGYGEPGSIDLDVQLEELNAVLEKAATTPSKED